MIFYILKARIGSIVSFLSYISLKTKMENIFVVVLFTSRWHPELIKYGLRGLLETPSVSSKDVCVYLVTVVSDSLPRYGLQHARLLCPQGFSRQEYWSGLPCPPPRDLPNPGIEPRSPTLQVDSLPSEPPDKPNSKDACQPLQNAKLHSLVRKRFGAL